MICSSYGGKNVHIHYRNKLGPEIRFELQINSSYGCCIILVQHENTKIIILYPLIQLCTFEKLEK